MKRRNAESGKLRRPLKRSKIAEGMYGNSMLYLKFVMLWATVVLADYMLEFRFEFLWPFWMMMRSICDSFKYQGIAFSVFFICIALTSDMICFFFIPLQYIFFAASTYVWVQYVWYSFADKGICLPTVAICCVVVYVEGALRVEGRADELCRPLAAHCVGYPVVSLGFGVKSYVGHRLRLRRQRHVRDQNEFYFRLMRDALPDAELDQSQQQAPGKEATPANPETSATETRHMNGSVKRKYNKTEANGHCGQEHANIQVKLDKIDKHLAQHTTTRERDKSAHNHTHANTNTNAQNNAHAHTNGTACHAHADEDEPKHDHSKGGVKSSQCEKKEAIPLKEEKRKNRNKDKDKENTDSNKSMEYTKEQMIKELEILRECAKSKECNQKEKEKERETREREKERERERELREVRSCAEELRRVRGELAAARGGEAEARRALAAAAAAERARRADHLQLKQAHAALQHKVSTWRCSERAALERRLGEERRARTAAENQLLRAKQPRTHNGECDNEMCRSRHTSQDAEAAALRRELQRARERLAQLQHDLTQATDQVRTLEARQEEPTAPTTLLAGSWQALQARAAHLETSLSAETRVKLDLLSALGDAKRKMLIQEDVISRQEKEIEELKAQMLAVLPPAYVSAAAGAGAVAGAGAGAGGGALAKLRRADGSPLDPNATVYTPKQLCSDA